MNNPLREASTRDIERVLNSQLEFVVRIDRRFSIDQNKDYFHVETRDGRHVDVPLCRDSTMESLNAAINEALKIRSRHGKFSKRNRRDRIRYCYGGV